MKTRAKNKDMHQEITNTIIDKIENREDLGRFEMPWHRFSIIPKNVFSEKMYRGMNYLWLHIMAEDNNFTTANWATFKQWKTAGAKVKKGSLSSRIMFYQPIEKEDDQGKEYTTFFIKSYSVFNRDQVENFEDDLSKLEDKISPLKAAEDLINSTGANIEIGGKGAFYAPSKDYINMPSKELFKSNSNGDETENYYRTLFHELIHWSGNETRTNRENFSSGEYEDYAFEELVADLGSAYLCAQVGIKPEGRDDHAQYIKSWLKALKNDKKFIFKAASKAQQAVDFINAFSEEKEEKIAA